MILLTESDYQRVKVSKDYATYMQEVKTVSPVTIDMVLNAITQVMGNKLPEYWNEITIDRNQDIIFAQHFGRYIAHHFSDSRMREIAQKFGGRDITVIYHSLKVIKNLHTYTPNHFRLLELEKIREQIVKMQTVNPTEDGDLSESA